MLKQLRLRMAAANIAMTGIVLAVLMLVMASLSESMYQNAWHTDFSSDVSEMVSVLRAADSVSGKWLAQCEARNRYVVMVESGGSPFHFRGAWAPPTERETLLKQAELSDPEGWRESPDTLRGDGARWLRYTVRGTQGESYPCIRVSIPIEGVETLLTVLGDQSVQREFIASRRVLYFGIFLFVLAALCLISWWYSGKAVRPAAESLQKQKAFIAAASHELRSPLAVIGASAAALRVKPEKTKLLDNIESECRQMGRLVDDMLLLANLDAKSWSMQYSVVELDTVLINTVDKLQEVADKRGCALRLDLSEDLLPPLRGDAARISQILAVLISNAAEYAGGEITVRAFPERESVSIEVEDHGPGIAPEAREKVFDRFYREDKSRTGKQHFGLGLSIARELARLHGGSLTLRETPGGGCTFRVTLPVNL